MEKAIDPEIPLTILHHDEHLVFPGYNVMVGQSRAAQDEELKRTSGVVGKPRAFVAPAEYNDAQLRYGYMVKRRTPPCIQALPALMLNATQQRATKLTTLGPSEGLQETSLAAQQSKSSTGARLAVLGITGE
ncbi:MAG: hypothetical protein Q9173_001243 [Seirophora scorigena]